MEDDREAILDLFEELNEKFNRLKDMVNQKPQATADMQLKRQISVVVEAVKALTKRVERLELDRKRDPEEEEIDDVFNRLAMDYFKTQKVLADLELARQIKKR